MRKTLVLGLLGKVCGVPATAVILVLGTAGCLTPSWSLPPVDLSKSGWTVRQGQAIWNLPQGKNDIAGEVLVATQADGSTFVQFSKSPFTLVIGQTMPKRWQVEFPSQDRRYAAEGQPPKRLIWLYLPRVLRGEPAPNGWKWSDSNGNWRLENPATGEAIEGFFEQ